MITSFRRFGHLVVSFAAGVLALTACASEDEVVTQNESNVIADGQKAGDTCGGKIPLRCAAGLVCIFGEAQQCGAADQTGHCFDPRVVRCAKMIDPVCGCDGKTYTNECFANIEGVSVRRDGACE